jgi:cold shock CspA family protein
MSEELQGEVAFWNSNSYGFIKPDKGGADIFFHVTELSPEHRVKKGDRVSFSIVPDQRNPEKLRATKVRLKERQRWAG